ncbi:MAG: prenyltransferase/squalene oxidase repeat-containing protein [Kiritimatiellia bacterium]
MSRTNSKNVIALLLMAAVLPSLGIAQEGVVKIQGTTPSAVTLDLSLRNEVYAAIDRGLNFLAANQKPDGSWSNGDFPALTALPLLAFVHGEHPRKKEIVEKAVAYLRSCVQPDGGIYRHVPGKKGGGLSTYNTAICAVALHAVGDPELRPVVLNARKFIAGVQHFGDDEYKGGFGYDRETGRPYTDLMNTYHAAEAMRLTQDVEDFRPGSEKRVDIDWKETVRFIERLQSKPESGADNAGGFVYNPSDPKAGTITNRQGVVFFRSYGSITYAGMLAMIYAELSPKDPRVVSAFDWAVRHWTLGENPGMGQQSLYFFYHILTKALTAAQRDVIPRPDGQAINWRAEVAKKLVSLQRIDPQTGAGYWKNDVNRFWEDDAILVTSYCLIALEMLL